jgi:hypothetical protein
MSIYYCCFLSYSCTPKGDGWFPGHLFWKGLSYPPAPSRLTLVAACGYHRACYQLNKQHDKTKGQHMTQVRAVGSRVWASQLQGTAHLNLPNVSASSSSHACPEVSTFGLSSASTQPLPDILGSLCSSSSTPWGHPSSGSSPIFRFVLFW